MAKRIVTYEIDDKLPDWATPAVLKAMHQEGKSFRKIGLLVGVSREKVRQLVKNAK